MGNPWNTIEPPSAAAVAEACERWAWRRALAEQAEAEAGGLDRTVSVLKTGKAAPRPDAARRKSLEAKLAGQKSAFYRRAASSASSLDDDGELRAAPAGARAASADGFTHVAAAAAGGRTPRKSSLLAAATSAASAGAQKLKSLSRG